MVGADRNFWLRFLNPKNTFFASVQFFHTHIVDYDKSIANAVASSTTIDQIAPELFAGNFHFVPRKEDEMTVTYLVNSLFWHGNLQPQIFVLMIAEAFIPSYLRLHTTMGQTCSLCLSTR